MSASDVDSCVVKPSPPRADYNAVKAQAQRIIDDHPGMFTSTTATKLAWRADWLAVELLPKRSWLEQTKKSLSKKQHTSGLVLAVSAIASPAGAPIMERIVNK
jgi:hypothetical protein